MMDVKVGKVIDMVKARVETSIQVLEDGMIVMKKWIYLHDNKILKIKVLKEAYESRFVIHSGSIKMYKDLEKCYWWPNIKKQMV